MMHYVAFHLDHHCLQSTRLGASTIQKVNAKDKQANVWIDGDLNLQHLMSHYLF